MKPRKRKQKRAVNKKPAFLAAFIACGSLTEAAAAVGINRHQHYDWLKADAKYVTAFTAARPEAVQTIIDSAVTRALRGVYEPNVYQGRFCYPQEEYIVTAGSPAIEAIDWKEPGGPVEARAEVKEVRAVRDVPGAAPLGVFRRSEMLHLALLRAWVPEFKTNVEVTGKDGGPIKSEHRIVFVKPGEI